MTYGMHQFYPYTNFCLGNAVQEICYASSKTSDGHSSEVNNIYMSPALAVLINQFVLPTPYNISYMP